AAFYNIPGLRTLGLQDSITVDVGDFYGNAVPDNTAISFKTYNTGGEMNPASAATSGIYANSFLDSVARPIPSQGFLSVTAEAVNGGRTTHITSLAVIPLTENKQMIYAGTDGGGVYRSADSGSTWQNISRSSTIQGQNWIDPYVNDIAVDPDNYDTVYAATGFLGEGHVYRSFDGGLTWNSNNIEEWNGVFSTDLVEGGSGAVLAVLCDDDGSDTGNRDRYVWIGTEGLGIFYATDGKHFTRSTSMGHGKIVQDIVKVDGTNGSFAQLYAGTATGVFHSADGGNTWNQPGSFLGNYITTLELYPKGSSAGNDVIYAGTEGAGVWVSTNSGKNWTNYHGGMGKGLSASAAKADRDNKGSGQITETSVKDSAGNFYKGTPSAIWTITYAPDNDKNDYDFLITYQGEDGLIDMSSVLGEENDYYLVPNMLRFKAEGDFIKTDERKTDTFTITTTRDPGSNIKDLMVDKKNNMLYAITYFYGEAEAHPVGNLYVHDLNIDGSMALGDWREANSNLPQFDPPDDTTIFGQHSLALDNPENPRALFIGGEGINFYKATSGLPNGEPEWKPSKSGLSNLIMARTPILFSGDCRMRIADREEFGDPVTRVVFTVYIEDDNGNPPIAGSNFTVTLNGAVEFTVDYSDTMIHSGTWRDPSDPLTDWPYIVPVSLDRTKENKIVLTFTPACGTVVPGCSGSIQTSPTYTYPKIDVD
ncbi:MAG: hypothetical protein V2I97_04615, partial [Desulfococcaceae bacterium]|nr:hypothetical protein [Desulfococcaceae bacterium]